MTPASLAFAPLERIDELIHSVNFHKGKAVAIKEISKQIHEEFNDTVPDDIGSLLSLPMVGRKTATCVLSYAFKKDYICVDTHVHRISNRIGLVHTSTPDETRSNLWKWYQRIFGEM